MVQTEGTIEELSRVSFLHETQPGSCCYRVHNPVLAFAKTVLLSRCGAPPRLDRRGVAGKQKARSKEEGERDEEEVDDGGAQDDDEEAAAATGTRKAAAVASQARYLSRVNTLLRFSGGGGSGTSVGEAEAARRCGEMVLLGGLPALAALWRSLEDIRWSERGGCGRARGQEDKWSAWTRTTTRSLLEDAYGAALEGMGACVEAASGYWAAAKLLQLQVRPDVLVLVLSANIHQQRAACCSQSIQAAEVVLGKSSFRARLCQVLNKT